MCGSTLAELMRVDRRTVGGICSRVAVSLEEADGRGRFDGLCLIGVDEVGYKKGQKCMTVVVHLRHVVWAARGHGRRRLDDFFDLLSNVQCAGIEVVTAGGALDRRRGGRAAAGRGARDRPVPRCRALGGGSVARLPVQGGAAGQSSTVTRLTSALRSTVSSPGRSAEVCRSSWSSPARSGGSGWVSCALSSWMSSMLAWMR